MEPMGRPEDTPKRFFDMIQGPRRSVVAADAWIWACAFQNPLIKEYTSNQIRDPILISGILLSLGNLEGLGFKGLGIELNVFRC